MQPFTAITSYTLRWVKPSWRKYQYELRDGAQTIATLDINGWMNKATGATAGGTYLFQRVGFWKQRMTVTDQASGTVIANYAPNWSGQRGDLVFASGATLHRELRGFWRQTTEWTTTTGEWLLRATANWKSEMQVELNPATITTPEVGVIALLTEYLAAVAQTEATVAASTASTAATTG